MRTTLTIEDDIAQRLQEMTKEREVAFKQVVNEALRRGIDQMDRPAKKRERFRIVPFNLGECLVPSLDKIEEVLDWAEGPWRR